MLTFLRLLVFCCCSLAVGCGSSQASRRADYLRATLPYDATILVDAAVTLRNEKTDSKALRLIDEAIRVDILRFQVCLADPTVPENDKKFARTVYQKLVSYASEHDVAVGYERGKKYEVLPNDVVLPDEMVVRDAIDQAIQHESPINRVTE